MRRWLCPLCLSVLVVNTFAAEPALDATDQRAIELALRAIKMSEQDLSFSKTNVESELVIPKARQFVQKPLALPVFAHDCLTNFQSATSLDKIAYWGSSQIKFGPGVGPGHYSTPTLKTDRLSSLPPSVRDAVNLIFKRAAMCTVAFRHTFPKNPAAPLAALAVSSLNMQTDPIETNSWQSMGLPLDFIRETLRREDSLELQDTELADLLLAGSDEFELGQVSIAFTFMAQAVSEAITSLQNNAYTEEFQTEIDSELGLIIIGGVGPNVYKKEAFLIIDLGGNDVYLNSAGGANGLLKRPFSIVIDLAGNDQYISRKSFSQGSGVFGIGILVDCAGDDIYEAKHLSQGAGFFGCGLLADYGGHDKFVADTFCQGAAEFGAGILWQRSGNTEYRAAQMGQGFGGTQGCGLLLDEAGNDSYFAGGKYACGWLPSHNFSLSQGFGYGMRPFAGGGVGILCDLKGDDHYVADVYGQGASYWYSVGLLLDAEGNDKYEAHQYCQGAGIHLSSAALIDWAGNDSYRAGHICQGAAHDYGVGMLIDRAGNDNYAGDTTAQGAAINNSFAMLLDHAGDDSYTGTDPKQSQAAGHDGDKREYGSIALMLDLAGNDSYSQGQSDNAVWLKPLYGAGLDTHFVGQAAGLPKLKTTAGEPPALQTGRLYQIAPVDPHHPIEHLLRLAMSDKPNAGKAWEELKQQGGNALPYLLTRLDSPNVLVRAKTEELIDHLGTNSIAVLIAGLDAAKNDEVARLCCYLLARFNEKARAAIPHVLPLLNRDKTRPVAFYTLGHLRARETFGPAIAALNDRELVRLRAVQALGKIGDPRAIAKLIPKLDDELYDVRYAAQDALVALGKPSIGPLRSAFAKATPRARPHIIEALAKLGDKRALDLAAKEYRQDDPLVRDAVFKSLRAALAAK